jgi:hypothetical protein
VARDSRGNIYVLSSVLPQVFDSSGRFVRTLGRIGDGPGELRVPSSLAIDRGDSITVVDARSSKLSVFEPGGRFAHSLTILPTATLFAAAFLPSGSLVGVGGRAGSGTPFHVVGSNGRVIRSFGNAGAALPSIAAGSDGSIWAAYNWHRIDHFDSTGTLLARYTIDADWFPPGNGDWTVNPKDPPPAETRKISVDESGLVWVFTYVPRDDWSKAVRPAGGGRGGYEYDAFLAYATRIEILDPVNRRLLVSQTVPLFITHALVGNFVAAYEETEAGIPTITITRLTLRR